MKEKGITTYVIRKENIISQSALTSLKNGKSVTTDTIERLCKCLNCQPGDIMEYIPDEEKNKSGQIVHSNRNGKEETQ